MNTQNSITIGDITIHQSENGLYSLKDLWVANGKRKNKQSSNWLKLETTKEQIQAARIIGGSQSQVLILNKGVKNELKGTYVSKELCYIYAMWLSPDFYFTVIRTFDQLANATTTQQLIDIKTQLDNVQLDLSYREPRDKNTLAVHLQVATSKLKPYFDHLVSIGELTREWVRQPDKAVYHATDKSQHVIGQKGRTVLFDDTVKRVFPEQVNWTD